MFHSCPLTNPEIKDELQSYWLFGDEIASMDGITKKDRAIVISVPSLGKALEQLYLNHMGIKKTRLLAYKAIYRVSMNANIEEIVKNCPTCFDFQST